MAWFKELIERYVYSQEKLANATVRCAQAQEQMLLVNADMAKVRKAESRVYIDSLIREKE